MKENFLERIQSHTRNNKYFFYILAYDVFRVGTNKAESENWWRLGSTHCTSYIKHAYQLF